MKYNQVRIGDGVIVKERNIVIHSLGTLNWDIYDCISSNHIADEVIITDDQIDPDCLTFCLSKNVSIQTVKV